MTAAGGSGAKNSPKVYLKAGQAVQLHEKEVYVKDLAELYCSDPHLLARCSSLKVKTFHQEKPGRYVMSILSVLKLLETTYPGIQAENLGEVDFVLDYQPHTGNRVVWQWAKTLFACVICFCGAAFAIMTFNNDVDVPSLFQNLFFLVMGYEESGVSVLELSYSVGLAVGILVFFNHFAAWKLNTDPTPLEVEMRLYEENLNKTLIKNQERKETDVDIS